MPTSWQHAYALKGTCISDDYFCMLSYFVQYQSITDKSDILAIASTVGITGGVSQVSNGHSKHDLFGQFLHNHRADKIQWKCSPKTK